MATPPSIVSWEGLVRHCVCFVSIVILIAATFICPARAERRLALVIGNDRYLNLPSNQQLERSVNDARAVGTALERLGFTVMLGENLDRRAMVDQLFKFTRQIEPGSTAFLFYAGHGVSISGGNYLLPTDIPQPQPDEEVRVRNMAIGEADIIADIQDRKARVAVLVLDACRDNPFRQPGLRTVGSERGLARIHEAEGVFAMYSAGFGQTALDRLGQNDPSPNSLFTRVLLPALGKPGVHLGDLAYEVREQVARLAEMAGHRQYPAYYDQTRGGRIYLVGLPKGAEPSAVAVVSPVKTETNQPDQASRESAFWDSIKGSKNPRLFEAYLKRYPDGIFADVAVINLEELKGLESKASVDQAGDKVLISDPRLLREVRDRHYELNFDPGPVNGPVGDSVRQAIREFEVRGNLPPSGQPTQSLLRRLRMVDELRPWGAIVYAKSSGKWGMSWDHASRKEAVGRARSSCGVNQCSIEVSFFGTECGAFALSGSNWAIVARDNIQRAKEAALEDCRKRGRGCRLIASVCADGAERFSAVK